MLLTCAQMLFPADAHAQARATGALDVRRQQADSVRRSRDSRFLRENVASSEVSRGPGLSRWTFEDDSLELPLPPQEDNHPSAWPSVGVGALVGSGAFIAGLLIYTRIDPPTDAIVHPLMFAPAVLVSAAVGALGGWIYHRVRYH